MVEAGWVQAEGAINQNLASGRAQQILPANHFGYSHGSVIDDNSELIGREIVVAPDHKIAEVLASNEPLQAKAGVHELDRLAIRHAKAPVRILCANFFGWNSFGRGDGCGR